MTPDQSQLIEAAKNLIAHLKTYKREGEYLRHLRLKLMGCIAAVEAEEKAGAGGPSDEEIIDWLEKQNTNRWSISRDEHENIVIMSRITGPSNFREAIRAAMGAKKEL